MGFKPDNYSTVSVYLIVRDAASTMRFLTEVFSAKALRSFADEDGRLMHCEVRIDDSIVMLADSGPDWPPVPGYAHVYVADVDATYARALEAGATSIQAPLQAGDGDKRGGVQDSDGNTWWLSMRVR